MAALFLFGLFWPVSHSGSAEAGELASDWVRGHASRVRLVAGRQIGLGYGAGHSGIVAGVVIELDDGWKTYWRNPGEAGGVPPDFDFSKSVNVAGAKVIYPAPKRISDQTGDTIGYKHAVVFPVLVTPAKASEPVVMNLEFAFGVCADICVPAEASMSLEVPANVSEKVPEEVLEAMDHVPREVDARRQGDPKLVSFKADLESKAPRIDLDVAFPGGAENGDLFVTSPDGLYVPMAKRVAGKGSEEQSAQFVIDLRDAFELDELKGKKLTLTMVGAEGQSQREIDLK